MPVLSTEFVVTFEQLRASEYVISLIMAGKTNVTDTVKFTDFCKLLDRIKYTRRQNEKVSILKTFLDELRGRVQNGPDMDRSLYHVMKLLLPKSERERGPYGLQETAMAKIIVRALGLSNRSDDANILNNFAIKTKGDFADAAYKILQKHFSSGGNINLTEVNRFLDTLADKSKIGRQRKSLRRLPHIS